MKIENLRKAQELADKLCKLKRCSDLLQGGGIVKVYGNDANTWEAVPDRGVCNELREAILDRIKDIEKEVETL